MSEENRTKVLHVVLSLAIRAIEWVFATYGEVAEDRLAAIIQARYGVDATPLIKSFNEVVAEYEAAYPVQN